MKVAIMQPYLFPYIGYWQLINCVDSFVLLDDVNYIRRGWMARNRYLCDGQERYFYLPVHKASQNKLISETELLYDGMQRENVWRTFQYAYRKSDCQDEVKYVIKSMIMKKEQRFTEYAVYTIETINKMLDIKTLVLQSSKLRQKDHPGGLEGIIQICRLLGADEYINPIGGIRLYDKELFRLNDIRLSFLRTDFARIQLQTNEEKMDLSIIDLLYRHDLTRIRSMLNYYELL